MGKPKLWTNKFIIITFINLSICLTYLLLMVIIPIYAIESFNSSPGAAGLAASIFIIGAILPRLLFGKWIERIGRKKTLYSGLILGLGMTLLYFAANSYLPLLIIRFFHGAAFGIATTATTTIAASIIPKERRGEGMAYFISLGITLSTAIGPFLGLFIIQHGSYNTIYLVCSIFAVLSLVNMFILSIPEIQLTDEQLRETKEFKLNGFFETKAIPIAIVSGVIYFCYSSVLTFLSAYSKEINLMDIASFFFVIVSVAILISRPFVGRLFDSKGENFVMYPAILILMMGLIILSQTHHGYTLLLAGALIGLGTGTIFSSCQTIVVKVVSPHRIGLATSTLFLFVDGALGIGPIAFGLFVPLAGYRGVYLGAAILVLICLFLYHLLHGKNAKPSKV